MMLMMTVMFLIALMTMMSVDDRDVCDVYVVHNFSDFHVVGLDDCDCLDGRDFHDLPW
jgi:hypothetical protein